MSPAEKTSKKDQTDRATCEWEGSGPRHTQSTVTKSTVIPGFLAHL